jgi:hypothetical protein
MDVRGYVNIIIINTMSMSCAGLVMSISLFLHRFLRGPLIGGSDETTDICLITPLSLRRLHRLYAHGLL